MKFRLSINLKSDDTRTFSGEYGKSATYAPFCKGLVLTEDTLDALTWINIKGCKIDKYQSVTISNEDF